MSIKSFNEIKQKALSLSPVRASIASAADIEVIRSAVNAVKEGIIINPVLTGDSDTIKNLLESENENPGDYEIVHSASHMESAFNAVKAVKGFDRGILIKGKLDTVFYLKAILDSERGIKKSKVLSNLTLFEMDTYHKLVAVSDNAIIPIPTLSEKITIIENTRILWKALEIDSPKVAALAAIEKINPAMQATVDAAHLSKMTQRGQIEDFIIDGPLSYDTAMDKKSAERKGFESEVSGDPDLLLMPSLETGNILGKAYKINGLADSGGLVMGASVPVVLNSRSDSAHRRFNSVIMARLIAEEIK
ncbi:MAG: phosphate acyltransferase [bacterium]